ncbi:MAG: hypothetical protein WD711_04495 [Dongiaceae bacterium]
MTKIIVLAAVVLAVWYGFRLIGRLDRERKAKARVAREAPPQRATAPGAAATAAAAVQDLIECRSCGAFVPAKRTLCSNCGAGI